LLRTLGLLLRAYSYLFHLTLSFFLLSVALLSAIGRHSFDLSMFPFSDEHMLRGIVGLAVTGLVCTLLAVTRTFKYLYPFWAAVVLYLMIKGFFFSAYYFTGNKALRGALWLLAAAALAFLGALWVLKPRRGRLYS
jgi:hypothetical protein